MTSVIFLIYHFYKFRMLMIRSSIHIFYTENIISPVYFSDSGLLALCILVVCREVKLSLWQFSPDFCCMIEEFFWN